jgi:hypothetical protein
MLCHRCQTDLPETELREISYPLISEEGREIRNALLCASCGPIVMMDSQRTFDINNRLQELMDIPSAKDTPTLTPAQLHEGNSESDEIFPLMLGRVPSTVPASLEAWCKTVTPSECTEASMARMVDAIGRD